VSFGVPWNHDPDSPAVSGECLVAAARTAGERLVADLDRARQLTREWLDRALSDALVEAAFSACLARLSETGCRGEANRLASGELWRIAGPVLEVGHMQWRARFKPRGYAGDYLMLEWILTDHRAEHPLGRAFDRYFQIQAAPQAVRSRTEETAAAMAAHCIEHDATDYRVVSVGSGPARDVLQAVGVLPPDRRGRLHVTLMDLDPEALDFARARLDPLLPPGSLGCVRENLYRLPQTPRMQEHLERADFLVCSGLFDYLDDATAAAMLGLFWRQLAPGGLLLAGNFAPHNPTRAYMEWIGNWYLTYRTADEMQRLALRAGIPPERFSVRSERLGVDLFVAANAF
jgi:extracellular factor (EF) 3-hydroxypalmitic acid methyl ester biosynthesis protein